VQVAAGGFEVAGQTVDVAQGYVGEALAVGGFAFVGEAQGITELQPRRLVLAHLVAGNPEIQVDHRAFTEEAHLGIVGQ